MSETAPVCEDVRLPHSGTTRLYPRGWCCERHTPAALQGKPESPTGPGWPSGAYADPPTPDPPTETEQP